MIRLRNPDISIHRSVSSILITKELIKFSSWLLRFLGNVICGKIEYKGFALLGTNSRIRGAKIILGNLTVVEENVRFQSLKKNSIVIGNSCRLGFNSDLQTGLSYSDPNGQIVLGNNVAVGPFSHIGGAGNVTIKSNTIIGPYLSVHSENHSYEQNGKLYRNQKVKRKGIIIGENCWLGAKVTVLDGVTIGDNCVVAAGSVVTKDIPSNSLIAGVPAVVMRSLNNI